MMRSRHVTPRDAIPDDVQSPQAKLIYLYLETVEETTLDELTETLRMRKIGALSVLDSLRSEGLIAKDGTRYRTAN